jgi:hypothetical protein
VLDGQDPGQVLDVMEVLAEVLLERLFPADQGAGMLRLLGELAALQAAQGAQ